MLALGFFTLLMAPLIAGSGLAALPRLRAPLAARLWLVPLAGAVVALLSLLLGEPAGALALPFGLPGFHPLLRLDGLSRLFLLALCLPFATALRVAAPARPAAAGLLFAGLLNVILAGDAYALLVGLALALGAAARLIATSRFFPMAAWLAWLLVLAALAPPLPDGTPNPAFVAMRALALPAAASGPVAGLVLLGAGLLGAPLFRPRVLAAAENGAVLAAALAPAVAYLAARFLGDLLALGAAGPIAALALGLGLAGALSAAAAAAWAEDIAVIVAAFVPLLLGESLFALGIAIWARRADLAAPGRDAVAAFLALALLSALAGPLLLLLARAVTREAGSRQLARLGGLLAPMPRAAALAGLALSVALPFGPGLLGGPLAMTALLRLPANGLGSVFLAALVALAGLLFALGGFAALRLFGLGFLGPPRSPRASAAADLAGRERSSLAVLAAALALFGLVPGIAARLIASAMPTLVAGDAATPTSMIAAPACAALLLFLTALLWAATGRGARLVARVWEEGYGPLPGWLPFGDPVTTIAPGAFGAELRAAAKLGLAILARRLRRPRAAWRAARDAWRAPPCG
ncbi:MAG: hypothetical protein ACP5M5_07880 [Acidibrevibacterium sp.]|uniref:hypothetical protein n=1 Tax=Acidibrevibacterium sp. TaxID=2606776 RepID=UPI003CFDABD7